MTIDVRPIGPDEFEAFLHVGEVVFAAEPQPEHVDSLRRSFEFDRTLACVDGGTLVGAAGSFSFHLTLPGLVPVPTAGVTYVGVLPTHRRRGLLRRMMTRQLADVHGRGEPVAVLIASESGIYGRFGYGAATMATRYRLSRHRAEWLRRPTAGEFRVVEPDDVVGALVPVYDAYWSSRVGEVSRNDSWWAHFVVPEKGEQGVRRVVVRRGPSGDDAFAVYRLVMDWDGGVSKGTLNVDQLVAVTPEAEADMLAFLLGVDLVDTVVLDHRPVDDPLRWWLADARQLRSSWTMDWLWVRLADAPTALASRRYRVEDRLAVDLVDEVCPWNAGTLVLEGGPDGATCKLVDGHAGDLRMGARQLGSMLLGGVS
ncbi:MAG TPA: GNAT family N-acetyltransferase, partial [Acidimicrobiales bacterium]|nr:GNAT family N-acetyltransferase [Acidimicrobiales bacterium]